MNRNLLIILLIIVVVILGGVYLTKSTAQLPNSTMEQTTSEVQNSIVTETPPAQPEDDVENELNRVDQVLNETDESDFDNTTLSDLE